MHLSKSDVRASKLKLMCEKVERVGQRENVFSRACQTPSWRFLKQGSGDDLNDYLPVKNVMRFAKLKTMYREIKREWNISFSDYCKTCCLFLECAGGDMAAFKVKEHLTVEIKGKGFTFTELKEFHTQCKPFGLLIVLVTNNIFIAQCITILGFKKTGEVWTWKEV